MRRHSSVLRPRSTVTVTNLVAPSASRTMACARQRATSVTASSSAWTSRAADAIGPAPLAISTNESLVEVSPSTVMQLNERWAARFSIAFNWARPTPASVATKPSMVAMSGRIMPAPLAIPETVASPLLNLTLRDAALGTVSVVMMASAADSQSALPLNACGSPAMIRSAGSGSMITPVENGSTCVGLQPSRAASARQTCMARFTPSAPVPAFALPVFTTSARTPFFKCCLASSTGAAQKRLRVNTPATVAPASSLMTSRSLRPALRIAAIATPKTTPATRCSEAPSGGARFTAISGQLAVAVLVFLARAARAGFVATDLLGCAHSWPLLRRRLGDRHVAVRLDRSVVVLGVLQAHVLDMGLVVYLGRLLRILHVGQRLDDLELDRLHHRAEQLERFPLVFLLRVLLRVTAQVDALAQVIQRREVLAPVSVQNLQHDVALGLVHALFQPGRNLQPVSLARRRDDALEHGLLAEAGCVVQPFAHRQLEVELCL